MSDVFRAFGHSWRISLFSQPLFSFLWTCPRTSSALLFFLFTFKAFQPVLSQLGNDLWVPRIRADVSSHALSSAPVPRPQICGVPAPSPRQVDRRPTISGSREVDRQAGSQVGSTAISKKNSQKRGRGIGNWYKYSNILYIYRQRRGSSELHESPYT